MTGDCPGGEAIDGHGDLRYLDRGQVVEFLNSTDPAVMPPSTVDFDTCAAATNDVRLVHVQDLIVSETMCRRTSEDDHALLTITELQAFDLEAPDDDLAHTEAITFDVTVWSA